MTSEELLRILSFVDSMRNLSEKRTSLASVDARWNIISYCMRRHMEGKLLTVTSVAMAADVPYGTAMRRIDELINQGLLMRRPRSKTGKSFSLHPTRAMIAEYESFALQLKAMVGNTFGFGIGETPIEDFYFGGYYMASRILSYPNAMRNAAGSDKTVRILSPKDPTFKTLSDFSRNLNELCGTRIEITNLPLDKLHQAIMENHAKPVSAYDIVAIDLPWVGQLSEENVIRPLDDIIARERYNASDFHNAAWKGSGYGDKQYGLPIQPTAELLFCRSDLFAEAGLSLPRTTDEVLFAARTLHRSAMSLSGIVMNFGRGMPVAHTFLQTMADFGQPIINLSRLGNGFDVETIKGEQFRPMIDTEAGHRTAQYLRQLSEFVHPESMRCSWDKRIALFARGEAAMTYGWSIRSAVFELDDTARAHGKVEFLPHPPAPGLKPVSPIGGFSLAIPAHLDDTQVKTAWKVMEYLTRPELLKWYAQSGNLTSPRFSTSADPEVQAMSKVIGQVDAMERRGELQIWPRPPIPEFHDLIIVLGECIYMMLQGEITIPEALAQAQSEADAIMRARGRY